MTVHILNFECTITPESYQHDQNNGSFSVIWSAQLAIYKVEIIVFLNVLEKDLEDN